MIGLALVVAAATLAAGVALALALRLLPSVRLQLAGLALLAVTLPLAAVFLTGWAMFHMGDDVEILAVTVAAASVAVGASLLVARTIGIRIGRLRDASTALAAGDLSARADEGGPRELADLARSFNAMAADLERLFDARRELVAWASHDLRTPIASLQAMLEAIEDGLVEPEAYLPALQEQVRTLGLRVDDLFELARIDAGALTLELRETEVGDLVDACVAALEAEAALRGVHLQARTADARAVRAGEDRARRPQSRHERAAAHAERRLGRGRGRSRARAGARLGRGHGCRPRAWGGAHDVRPLLARRPRPLGDGAGLGLAIARGLVEAHGGRIWAEGRSEGGARVSFTLPAG